MRVAEYIEALGREGELLAATVAATDLAAQVPTCPEWTVRELAHHIGRVHRWATVYVRDGCSHEMSPEEERLAWGDMPTDPALGSWLSRGHAGLVEALARATDDLSCWTFLPAPTPLVFWARRQAHETAIHRVDAQSAAGPPSGVDTGFALDGIDELLVAFFSGRGRGWTDRAQTMVVAATDANVAWSVQLGPSGCLASTLDPGQIAAVQGSADAYLAGPASALYLGLWNRTRLDELLRGGDRELITLWQRRARVRWS